MIHIMIQRSLLYQILFIILVCLASSPVLSAFQTPLALLNKRHEMHETSCRYSDDRYDESCVNLSKDDILGIWQISGHFDLAPPSRNTKEYTYHTTLSTLPTSITFYSDNTYAYSPPSSLNPSIDPLISSSGHYTLNSTHLLLTTSLTSLANQPIAIYLSGTCPSEGFIKGRAFSGDRYVYPLSHPKVLEGPVIFKEEEAKGSWTMKRIFKGESWVRI
mmetsp:Transcript_20997/g.39323  ORF Transcript_20997/g.39323 Transcript_20997/m.39323 type:complete len:218 (+) Transcript_20997:106-759(+)